MFYYQPGSTKSIYFACNIHSKIYQPLYALITLYTCRIQTQFNQLFIAICRAHRSFYFSCMYLARTARSSCCIIQCYLVSISTQFTNLRSVRADWLGQAKPGWISFLIYQNTFSLRRLEGIHPSLGWHNRISLGQGKAVLEELACASLNDYDILFIGHNYSNEMFKTKSDIVNMWQFLINIEHVS